MTHPDTQAALTAALEALEFIKQWGECALAVEKRDAAIEQIEALKGQTP